MPINISRRERMKGHGPDGMTIKEAVKGVITETNRATSDEIFEKVKKIYCWGDHAILRHIMGQTINLQAAYYEWPQFHDKDRCLFLCENGYYVKYDELKHGKFTNGIRVA
jgi:hypothetical protein